MRFKLTTQSFEMMGKMVQSKICDALLTPLTIEMTCLGNSKRHNANGWNKCLCDNWKVFQITQLTDTTHFKLSLFSGIPKHIYSFNHTYHH